MFLVRCPQCHHDQKYVPMRASDQMILTGKKKACVYCGRSFSVAEHLLRKC